MTTPKTDYLKEDPALAGQAYSIVSFINPKDKVLAKHLYYTNNFMVHDINKMILAQGVQMVRKIAVNMREKINPVLDRLKSSLDPEDKHMSRLLEEQFRDMSIDEDAFLAESKRQYEMNEEEIMDKYKIYLAEHRNGLDVQFDKQNSDTTSLRGFKVRGGFARIEDAKERAKFLRDTVEPAIHTFIVPMGTWFPVDMDADEVQDQDYMLPQLNDLMGKYHEGVQARNQHYQERKLEMMEASKAQSTKARLQEKIKQKEKEGV